MPLALAPAAAVPGARVATSSARRVAAGRPGGSRRSATAAPRGPLVLVSAFPPELAPLRRLLHTAALRPRVAGGDIVCEAVGIGLVEAALGIERLLATLPRPRALLFVGTAGSYTRALPLLTVAIADELVLASTAVLRGDGYLPEAVPTRATTSARLSARLLAASLGVPGLVARRAAVANPLAITRRAPVARQLARATAAEAENLEVFAVGRAASRRRIPFGAVLGIANRVGPSAHEEWAAHHARASAAACAVVAAYLLAEDRAARAARS